MSLEMSSDGRKQSEPLEKAWRKGPVGEVLDLTEESYEAKTKVANLSDGEKKMLDLLRQFSKNRDTTAVSKLFFADQHPMLNRLGGGEVIDMIKTSQYNKLFDGFNGVDFQSALEKIGKVLG